jgi:hypothetical protein
MAFRFRFPKAASMRLIPAMLGLACGAQAAITLTQAPSGMRKQSAEITLGWTGGQGRVHLRASTAPGGTGVAISHYDSLHLPSQLDVGTYTFKVNPDIPVLYRNTDLRFGINYCILTDGAQASPEFIIIIESGNAPVLTSPANAASRFRRAVQDRRRRYGERGQRHLADHHAVHHRPLRRSRSFGNQYRARAAPDFRQDL